MFQRRVFPIVAAVAAAALVFGGCAPAVKDARFRSISLTPVSEEDMETVADLQVIGNQKVIGVAKGVVTSPEQRTNLYVEALETALASAPLGADVLVAPSFYEVTEDKVNVTYTIVGYPARYKNFRRDTRSAEPFSVRTLPSGAMVLSYDKNTFTAKLAGEGVVAVQAIKKEEKPTASTAAPVAPVAPVAPAATVEQTTPTAIQGE